MIYDFTIIDRSTFEVNGKRYKRQFRVVEKGNGSARVDIPTNGLYLGVYKLYEITINSIPITSFAQLEDVVYNSSCTCGNDPIEPEVYTRIFDQFEDLTFE